MKVLTQFLALFSLYTIHPNMIGAMKTPNASWFGTSRPSRSSSSISSSTSWPTPSASSSSTPWPTPSASSSTASSTASSTPWPTPSASSSSTPWPTPSASSSSTPWPTPSASSSSTPWPTPSASSSTASSTASSTPWPTPSASSSSTPWPTPSASSSTLTWPSSSPPTPSFYKINILLARNVQLQATSYPTDYSTTITCDDPSILPYVQANVTQDSTLIVSATTDCDGVIRAYTYQAIYIDYVSRLSMTSYSYKGYQLGLVSMGNAQIEIANIGFDIAEFTFFGNSTVSLSGTVGRLTVTNRGKGSVDTTRIVTPSVNAIQTGTGSLQVKSSADMNITVGGAGTLTWCSPRAQMDVAPDTYVKKNIIYRC